jgi:Ca2+-binding EF-hand superfamily protein
MTKRMKIAIAALMVSAVGAAAIPSFADTTTATTPTTPPAAGLRLADKGGPGPGRFDRDHGRPGMKGPGMNGPRMGRPGKGGPGMGGPGPDRGAKLIEKYDTNKDGKVTKEEIDTARADQLKKYDTNGDGVLSIEEYQVLWLDNMHEAMVRSFQRLDADGTATVTVEEFDRNIDRMIDHLDRNHDGVIDQSELAGPRGPRADRAGGPPPIPGQGPGAGKGPGAPTQN